METDTIKYAGMKEKRKKENLRKTRKLLQTKLHSRNLIRGDKYPDCVPRKTILKMNGRKTSTNEPENEKTHDDA